MVIGRLNFCVNDGGRDVENDGIKDCLWMIHFLLDENMEEDNNDDDDDEWFVDNDDFEMILGCRQHDVDLIRRPVTGSNEDDVLGFVNMSNLWLYFKYSNR